MPYRVFIQSYRELRRPVMLWTMALLAMVSLVLLAFPLMQRFMDLNWLGSQSSASFLFGAEPGSLRLGQLGGWIEAAGFGLLFPLAAAVYASLMGSWLVAGEEERGSLGLLLAAPVARWRFMLEKTAVLVVVLARPLLAVGLVLLLANRLGAGITGLSSRLVGLFLLALLFGALGLALGSLSGRRRLSLLITLAGLLLAFAVSRVPAWLPAGPILRLVSPVYLYEVAAASPVFLLALLLLALACLGAGWAGFERRDLAV